jgi:hypothetical protein
MPVCIFNMLARSSCQPLLRQLLQQTTPLYTNPCCLSCCPCCRLQPLRPPMPALTHSCPLPSPLSIAILLPSCLLCTAAATAHHNCAAGWPQPSLSPIAIMLPAAPAHCRTHAPAAARCRMHAATAARCCTHAASAACCCTHAGCLPSIAIVPPAAAACCRTHACCLLPHPRRRCCLLLHARRIHHCSRHHCHLHHCWCHVH